MSKTVIKVFKNGTLVSETGFEVDDAKKYEVKLAMEGPCVDVVRLEEGVAKGVEVAMSAYPRNVLAFLAGCGIADDNLADAHDTIAKALEVQGVAEEMLADVERLERERDEARAERDKHIGAINRAQISEHDLRKQATDFNRQLCEALGCDRASLLETATEVKHLRTDLGGYLPVGYDQAMPIGDMVHKVMNAIEDAAHKRGMGASRKRITKLEEQHKAQAETIKEYHDSAYADAEGARPGMKVAEALSMLDEAGSRYEDDLVASLRWFIDDTNRRQQAVIDAAKSCGIDSIDAGEAAGCMAEAVRAAEARGEAWIGEWKSSAAKADFWLSEWKESEGQKTEMMYEIANLKGALAASEARR